MKKILLVGTGEIAPSYIEALQKFDAFEIDLLGNDADKSRALANQHGISQGHGGGTRKLSEIAQNYSLIILAASIDALSELIDAALGSNFEGRVLVEKPVALSMETLQNIVQKYGDEQRISVALNRIFFPSIQKMSAILRDEVPLSAEMSFTEWVHRIEPDKYSSNSLANWGYSNCIHVIATFFWLLGPPKEMTAFVGGENAIDWHKNGAVFCGAGETTSGTLFSYHSNWCSAGRWYLKIYTEKGCYDLTPMEGINFIPKGTVKSEQLLQPFIGDTKCGFSEMLEAFIYNGEDQIGLTEYLELLKATKAIFKYED